MVRPLGGSQALQPDAPRATFTTMQTPTSNPLLKPFYGKQEIVKVLFVIIASTPSVMLDPAALVSLAIEGLNLTSPPLGLNQPQPPPGTPKIKRGPLEVQTDVLHVANNFTALHELSHDGKTREYDNIVILGFEDDTADSEPKVMLEMSAKRLGYVLDQLDIGYSTEVVEDGSNGFRGQRDTYYSTVDFERVLKGLQAQGFSLVSSRLTGPGYQGGGGRCYCEYAYGELLRDTDTARVRKKILLMHLPPLQASGGPYEPEEYIALCKCVAWNLVTIG